MCTDLTINSDTETIRHQQTIRDSRTGELSHKPSAPRMRTVIKGGWVYREVESPPPPDSDKSNTTIIAGTAKMAKELARIMAILAGMAIGWAVTACVQVQPVACPPGSQCPPSNITITSAIMATVPVSALPGAP